MRLKTFAIAAAALALPLLASAPSEAKTAFQNWAQGRGVYVSSKDHPPFELQGFLVGGAYGPYAPALPPGGYYPGAVPPAYDNGYGYGYAGY